MTWYDPSDTESGLVPLDVPATLEPLSPEQQATNNATARAVLARLEGEASLARQRMVEDRSSIDGAKVVWQSVMEVQ